jgi:hypothetical protein
MFYDEILISTACMTRGSSRPLGTHLQGLPSDPGPSAPEPMRHAAPAQALQQQGVQLRRAWSGTDSHTIKLPKSCCCGCCRPRSGMGASTASAAQHASHQAQRAPVHMASAQMLICTPAAENIESASAAVERRLQAVFECQHARQDVSQWTPLHMPRIWPWPVDPAGPTLLNCMCVQTHLPVTLTAGDNSGWRPPCPCEQ